MGHTRHRSLTTLRSYYVRCSKLGRGSPAGNWGCDGRGKEPVRWITPLLSARVVLVML
jgi:hypothetical protein